MHHFYNIYILLCRVVSRATAILSLVFVIVIPLNANAQLTSGDGDSQSGKTIFNFGDIQTNTTAVEYLTITAESSVTFGGATTATNSSGMAVDTSTLANTPFSIKPEDDGCKGRTLAVAETCVIVVRFSPVAEASFSSYIKVKTTSPVGYPGFFINLNGKGVSGGAAVGGTLAISLASGAFTPISRFEMNAIEGQNATKILALRATGGSVSIKGTKAPTGWSFDSALCGDSVQVGLDCPVIVTANLSLLASGTYYEQLVLQASDGIHVMDVTISITAKASQTPGALVVSPSTLNFGDLRPGTKSVKTLTLTASGSNVAFETLEVPEGYTAMHSCGTMIPAGSSCSASITFQPTATIPYYGSAIISTAAAGSPHTVTLTGNGSSSSSGSTSSSPLLVIGSGLVEFGEVAMGSSSQREIKLSNRGGAVLNASLVVSSDAYSASGSCISPNSITGNSLSVTIPANSVCTMFVNFTSKSVGEQAGTLRFTDTDTEGMTISLRGVGVASAATGITTGLSATPTSMMFGAVNVGSSLPKSIRLTKANGASKPIIASVSVPDGYIYEHDCATSVSTACTLTVIFTPTSTAKYDGLIIINDLGGETSMIMVTGEGTANAQMTARTSAAGSNLDVTGQFAFAAGKVDSAGNLYVAVLYQDSLFFMSSGQWTPYVPGKEPPAYATADATRSELTILVNQDVSSMSGAVLFLGYGRDISEVISKRQYTPVHVIE